MHSTPGSLLERLRRSPEPDSWARFVQLYAPLIYSWARRANVPHQEAADLVQEVLTLLVEKLPNFVYDRNKSFRRWLQAEYRAFRKTQEDE